MIPPRIVAFGSSSVHGRGDAEHGGFVGRFRAWFEPQDSRNCVFNLGVVGDSSCGMLARFESEVSFRRPGLILLYPGLNDTRRQGSSDAEMATSVQKFGENLLALLQRSVTTAPTIFISAFPVDDSRTTPWQTTNLFYLKKDADVFTAIGRELCNDLKITYLPVSETWGAEQGIEELSLDGLHGTPEAHRRLFTELRTTLLAMFPGDKVG